MTFWSDSMWRRFRIFSFFTSGFTLAILAIYLLRGRSWRTPLVVAVVVNFVTYIFLVRRTLQLRGRRGHTSS